MTWLVDADVTEPQIDPQIVASGGEQSQITVNGQLYRVHTYRVGMFAPFTLEVETGGIADMLIVGAGGAGGDVPTSGDLIFGYAGAGGGGGGGVIEAKINLEGDTLYTITVGSTSGADSYISNGSIEFRAKGGGKGGSITGTGLTSSAGQDGGSSGGGACENTASPGSTNAGDRTFGQGNNGGDAIEQASGGGGGATSPARDAQLDVPATGGNGYPSAINGTLAYYGGGGGGIANRPGSTSIPPLESSLGGIGGGGQGASLSDDSTAGTNGLGGGGGAGLCWMEGASYFQKPGSAGGNGIVIIRYPIEG